MSTDRREIRLEISTMLFLLAAAMLFAPQSTSAAPPKADSPAARALSNPRALIEQTVENEVKAENDDSTHWRFSKTTMKDGLSKTWDVIETKKGEVQRLVEVNDHPLDAEQQRAEQQRIQRFLGNANEQQRKREASSKDFRKEQQLMKMLPNALLYTYVGQQGDLAQFRFWPNPQFHATTREAEVFHHMSGILVINLKNQRLAQLRGHLTSGVKFGYGILGYLDKGGTFDVEQQDVGDNHWDVTLLETDITGKALFFKSISVREKITESDYHRVSDDLTLRQAANMLKSSASRTASEAKISSPGRVVVASAGR